MIDETGLDRASPMPEIMPIPFCQRIPCFWRKFKYYFGYYYLLPRKKTDFKRI